MQSVSRKPSLLRIIQTDNMALLAVGFPTMAFLMYAIFSYFAYLPGFRDHDLIRSSQLAPLFLNLGLATSVVGLLLLIVRIHAYATLYSHSVEVPGRVISVSFVGDRAKVEYSYSYQGRIYQGSSVIIKNARTRNLSRGYEVMLLFDRRHPEKALLRDLYV